jgi:prepilin-type processing-associated H-X9-DG protein
MKQMALAMQNHLDYQQRFPTSGEGVDPATGAAVFEKYSTFTAMLPFIEHGDIHDRIDLNYAYNDSVNAPGNQAAAKFAIPTYLCPSNPYRPANGQDAAGYGYTDYMSVSYVDLNGAGPGPTGDNNLRDATWPDNKMTGALKFGGTVAAEIRDGLSVTMGLMEDVGRSELYYPATAVDPIATDLLPAGNVNRNGWRWAEPDSGNGVSGPPGAKFNTPNLRIISNNQHPVGGPPSCGWSFSNCGVNDEPFSFHGGGCNAAFMDGHVSYILDRIDPIALRRLLTPKEGLPPATISGVSFSDY